MGVDFRLYLITDRKIFPDDRALLHGVEQALKGGVRAVQLREKEMETRRLLSLAYSLRALTAQYGARLFVNERADIAVAAAADGVHLGTAGIPVEAARRVVGNRQLLGSSAHSLEEALSAEKAGADFITFGPVFDTPSKRQYGKPVGPELLRRAAQTSRLPVFAIGGIKKDSVKDILASGAYGIALISGILAAEDIKSETEDFMRAIS